MTIDGEPAKILLPYLQRADELQKHDHLAAYYCRLYAMEKGLKIPPKERTNETKLILVSLMSQLEKDKKVVKLSPDDNMYMEGFALRVFAKADKQDRAGRADLKTAMTFYAASIFFEVLLQFGELPPDIQEKQKYASWKAVDIRKALAEGRKPVPGPPVPENDVLDGEDTTFNTSTEGHTSNAPPPPEPQQPLSPPRSSQDTTTSFNTPTYPDTHRTVTPPPPSEPPSFPPSSYNKSSSDDDFSLPSAPSNPIPPSYTQNPYAPPDPNAGYPPSAHSYHQHSSSSPFDSPPGPHIGTYSYPSDPPGFTTSTQPSYSSYSSQDSGHYNQQSPQWPSSNYPSVFPSGYQQPPPPTPPPAAPAPQYPQAPPARTSSAPVDRPSTKPSTGGGGGYQLNGDYDSDYKPTPGQVVEAHKASRFAVSALAFDDIPTAISYLRKSLELLTSPSAAE